KGSAVLSMFEGFLGEELFRKGIHAYLTKYASRNANTSDFIGTIAETATAHPLAKPENVTIAIGSKGDISWNGHTVPSMAALIDQLSHMSAGATPQQLSAAFASFIYQPGVPRLSVRLECDGAALARVTQNPYTALGEHPSSRQWRVPACFAVTPNDK